ncbi:hypothetical protein [Kitasatospora sp. NPDC101183]|uniref:hypothetical protein n=1 Tax=Kitasatospora sp. NPDC101183 TaxID=3364100 RepID=UPI0037F7A492
MSIGTRALRSAGATTIALATVCTLTLGTAGSAAADTDPSATVAVDLPLPPGAVSSYPAGLNDSGVVVGYGTDANYRMFPVRWNADLSAAALPLVAGDTSGYALGISNEGSSIGFSGNHPVRWAADGTVTTLQSLPGDTPNSGYPRAISSTGTVVGESYNGAYHAAKWGPDGKAVPLAALSGDTNTYALSINSSGTVAGLSFAVDGTFHPVKWGPDGIPVALDPASAYRSVWIVRINDAGTVLARATPTGAANDQWRSLTWNTNGTVTDFGRYSTAQAINASGTVVGRRTGADGADYTATSWSPDGTATTLGADFDYTVAAAVNDAGVSVGHTGTKVPNAQERYALRWEADGSQTELNVAPADSYSYALFVNNASVVVGVRAGSANRAVIWRP